VFGFSPEETLAAFGTTTNAAVTRDFSESTTMRRIEDNQMRKMLPIAPVVLRKMSQSRRIRILVDVVIVVPKQVGNSILAWLSVHKLSILDA
jgi:Holliday junction resolvase-like predicted endonuclease